MRRFSEKQAVESMQTALEALHGITLLQGVLRDAAGQSILALLRALTATEQDKAAVAEAYSQAFHILALAAINEEHSQGHSDAWQTHLINRILDDTNPLSMLAEKYGPTGISATLRSQAERDLRGLGQLFQLNAQMFWNMARSIVTPSLPMLHDAWVPWSDLTLPVLKPEPTVRDSIFYRMVESGDWSSLVDTLTAYWAQQGTGQLARYHILRWQGGAEGLQGITHPDPIQLRELIGYGRQHARLQTNTERFLRGLPAHDAVLYGAPGTGKSSTVKALANMYAPRGLRLIELRKELVSDLPRLVAQIRGRAPRFLIFIDDLSFEDHETEYKALKVLLEGSAEARPNNVLIYATTNRLNFIREHFSDRGKPLDDIHWRDTVDEKNSLVARFGLRVTFTTPDQEQYLKIAVTLAQQRGLDLPEEELRERALSWERQRSGRSGRLARQFVDDLEAEQGYEEQMIS